MILGTSSPLTHNSPKEWAKKHKDLGLRAINFPLTVLDDEALIDEYAAEAKANDLVIAEVGVWRNPLDLDPLASEKAIFYTIGQLKLADRINARCCVNILGARGSRWDGAYKANFSSETWDLGVRTIQRIIDEANPKNTFFTIESMPWMYPTGPDEYLQLLEDVDRERFAVHLDIFNWMYSVKRYFNNEEFIDECFEKLGKHIKSCHLKDVKLQEEYTLNFKETYPGNGEINIKHLIDTALKYDSDMSFIIEHLNTDEEYLSSVEYIKKLMNS
ncbi:MAG: sugar phosphate isomerase/epimerase [Lachnospiraceae bacterium]|nr:sugar phosphate isomerase/epimerase [Lachnospiraceae bacterium]